MNKEVNIVLDEKSNQLVVSSLQVAEDFGKEHKHVLEIIRKMTAENSALLDMFYESTYRSKQNKALPMYLMNRDGFSLLVMGFTGKEALNWKIKYVEAFNKMESRLKSQQQLPNSRSDKALLAQAKILNAKSRAAAIWLKLGDRMSENRTYRQICNSYASEALIGEKVLPLPECHEKYYSATEVAKMVGSNHVTVGKKAKAAGIRPLNENSQSDFGKWFFDKSPNSNKQVTTFKYNEKGVNAIKALFNARMA